MRILPNNFQEITLPAEYNNVKWLSENFFDKKEGLIKEHDAEDIKKRSNPILQKVFDWALDTKKFPVKTINKELLNEVTETIEVLGPEKAAEYWRNFLPENLKRICRIVAWRGKKKGD